MLNSEMKIKNFEVWVSLGCSPSEQAQLQPVLFNVDILFKSKVLAEDSDRLEDSINYVELTDSIKAEAEKKPYNMIEHLGLNVAKAMQQKLSGRYTGAILSVHTLKLRAPVKNLQGGVEWLCRLTL